MHQPHESDDLSRPLDEARSALEDVFGEIPDDIWNSLAVGFQVSLNCGASPDEALANAVALSEPLQLWAERRSPGRTRWARVASLALTGVFALSVGIWAGAGFTRDSDSVLEANPSSMIDAETRTVEPHRRTLASGSNRAEGAGDARSSEGASWEEALAPQEVADPWPFDSDQLHPRSVDEATALGDRTVTAHKHPRWVRLATEHILSLPDPHGIVIQEPTFKDVTVQSWISIVGDSRDARAMGWLVGWLDHTHGRIAKSAAMELDFRRRGGEVIPPDALMKVHRLLGKTEGLPQRDG